MTSPAEFGLRDQLFLAQEMTEACHLSFASGALAVFSSRSPTRTTANQDAAVVLRIDGQRGILAVADGAGGLPDGEQASRLALEALVTALDRAVHDGAELRDAILNGFEGANQAVLATGTRAATTLAVVEVQERSIRPYHVGDSLILVVGQRGRTKLQTVAHSPVGYAVEAGLLTEHEAMHHADRHLVSNMVGIPEMRIEIGASFELAPKDTLLIATDGLSDNLGTDEIVERIRRGPLPAAATALMAESAARMREPRDGRPSKPDDLTFMLFRRNG